jgi:hypothetical protein
MIGIRQVRFVALPLAAAAVLTVPLAHSAPVPGPPERDGAFEVRVQGAAARDVSPPLSVLLELTAQVPATGALDCDPGGSGCGTSPAAVVRRETASGPGPAQGAEIEQRVPGERPPAVLLESFDGHGYGLVGPHGPGRGGNPSDNSMAVGPNHVVETVNGGGMVVYTRKGELFERSGEVLFGPIGVNVLFNGFGGECERVPNGDHVVRYDQLAGRWLHVMPLFRRAVNVPPGDTIAPYGMCYAISTGANPLGPYYRYYFERELFPDYPRPAIWPDGYYIPTSTGDNRLPDGSQPHKHACVLERDKVLRGLPAREQCVITRYPNFFNNADIDGQALPPAGAPNIMMAAGGAQLDSIYHDEVIHYWKFHVDWVNPANTRLDGPHRIAVAPYHFLCNGQLTRCVPQPGTDMRLDSQGDKIMQRLVYRNVDGRQSIVAVHSVNTTAGGGGVRWYEFRLDERFDPLLFQQSTYAPDSLYRWMASPGIDRAGNIGIGYSFGGTPHFAGQRFAGRLADDPPGQLTFRETVLVEGQAAQTNTLRWEDYTQLSMDPVDDCTMWYVGDYLKAGATSYTTRIGAFRLPGCLRGHLSGSIWFDPNHNGVREPNEPALRGWRVEYAGARRPHDRIPSPAGRLTTDSAGAYRVELPADPAYFEPTYALTAAAPTSASWGRIEQGVAYGNGGMVPMTNGGYNVPLRDREEVTRLDFGFVCTVVNTGGVQAAFWLGNAGRSRLSANHQPAPGRGGGAGAAGGRGRGGAVLPGWRGVVSNLRHLVSEDGSRLVIADSTFATAYTALATWLGGTGENPSHLASLALAVVSLNIEYGEQSGTATVLDPVVGDWPTVGNLAARASALIAANPVATAPGKARSDLEKYRQLLESLNRNTAAVTPADPARCARPF